MGERNLKLVADNKPRKRHILLLFACLAVVLGMGIYFLITDFSIQKIQISVNNSYTNAEIIEAMKGMMADFEISAINESTVMDVFPYSTDDKLMSESFKPVEKPDSFLTREADFYASEKVETEEELDEDLEEIEEEE